MCIRDRGGTEGVEEVEENSGGGPWGPRGQEDSRQGSGGSLSGPAGTKEAGACAGGPRMTLSTTHSPHLRAQAVAFEPQSDRAPLAPDLLITLRKGPL